VTNHPIPASRSIKDQTTHPAIGLRFCLLGDFRIQSGEKSLSTENIPLRKARDLLKILALAPDHRLHKEQLLEMLWPEHAPESALHSLSQTLYTLRPRLAELDPSARVELDHECLFLKADGGITSDVADFEWLARLALSPASPSDRDTAANTQAAIAVYQGDLLPEDGPADLFYQRRETLRQMFFDLLLQLADYHLQVHEYLPAIAALQKVIASDPANEAAHVQLMRAYALNGQRQAALRQYQVLESAVRSELDVEPDQESQRLRAQILDGTLSGQPAFLAWLEPPHHNLPALNSSFIGREAEVGEVLNRLDTCRLVTLMGAGGVGKTRLALKVAENLLDQYPGGVYWVELAVLGNDEMIAKAVLNVLHLPEQPGRSETDQLVAFLQNRRSLLLLDNCEHLLSACASLAGALLQACPQLHILATSRTRLNLPGEITYYVPSLSTPDAALWDSPSELTRFDAVRLFVERAGSYASTFRLTAANAHAVAQICARLDGIPLALELAAARIRMMTAEQIDSQLSNVFRLLVGGSPAGLPRHRTLQASIEWSYDLLSRQERLLLEHLSVFVGGCDLAGAEVVCTGDTLHQTELLDLLGSLVDQSLVMVVVLPQGAVRYHLLETVRQFALARLGEQGSEPAVRQKHLEYYLALAEQADLAIRGPQQFAWLALLAQERGNLTSALDWGLSSPDRAEMAVNLTCALTWYWGLVGDFFEMADYQQKALSASADFGSTAARARILYEAGNLSSLGGILLDPQSSRACIEESLSIWSGLEQDTTIEQTKCRLSLGWILANEFNECQGLMLLNECRINFQTLGNTWWEAWALNLLQMPFQLTADLQFLSAVEQEVTRLWEKTGDHWGLALPLSDWGMVLLNHGRFAEAREYLQCSLAMFEEFKSLGMAFQMMRDLGHAALALKEFDVAEMYYENCLMVLPKIGWDLHPATINWHLGFVLLHKGEPIRAQECFEQALKLSESSPLLLERLILCVAGLAALKAAQSQPVQAAQLFGACTSQLIARKVNVKVVERLEIDDFLARCRAQLDQVEFEQAWTEGSGMTLQQALAYYREPAY